MSPAAVMPSDTDSERGLLGACLVEPERVMPMIIEHGLRPIDFKDSICRKVFSAITELHRAGNPIDSITVKKLSKLSEVEVSGLQDACATWTHAAHYADAVQDTSKKRRLIELALSVQSAAGNGRPSVDIVADLREQLDSFDATGGAVPAVDASTWALESMPDPDEILTGAFDAGTKTVIVAPSKARKSFFMLQLAVSLAAGLSRFLVWDIPKPRRVLFWNLEITPAHFHKRLTRTLCAQDLTPGDLSNRLYVINSRGLDVHLADLSNVIKSRQIEVVFIDPIYKLIPGDESKQDEIKILLRGIDRLCTATGAAVVYCHHCGKGLAGDRQAIDRASGSGVLARDFDCQVTLTPHVDDGVLVVEQIARSYPPQDPFCIGWDNDRGCFAVMDNVDPVIQTSKNRNMSGRVGPALSDDDALAAVEDKPLPSEIFRGELQRRGFTVHGAREIKARLLENGKLAVVKSRTFPHKVYYGTPQGIANLQESWV